MRTQITAVFILASTTSALAQDLTTPAAIAAREKYEAKLDELRKQYSAELIEASKVAEKNGAREEVDRIDQIRLSLALGADDPVAAARERVEGHTWTFERIATLKGRHESKKLEFKKHRVVKITPGGGIGNWQMLEPHVGVVRTGGGTVFLMKFDERFSTYRVIAFEQVKSSFSGGRKVK